MDTQDTPILDCGHPESEHEKHTRGYGTMPDGSRHCYDCCAKMERDEMIQTGRATLYLTGTYPARNVRGIHRSQPMVDLKVTDWPGKLEFKVTSWRQSWHNFAGTDGRIDFWFYGPDETGADVALWHGYQIGQWNEIAHCRRTKTRRS